MAKLMGVVQSDKSSASRLSNHSIGGSFKTWQGKLDVTLMADGSYRVVENDKVVAIGNVNPNE